MNLNPTTPTELLAHLFDRMTSAQPKDTSPLDLVDARHRVYEYQRTFGLDPDPQVPSDRFLAQLLAITRGKQLPTLIAQLERERTPAGKEYSWYVLQVFKNIYGLDLRQNALETTPR